MKRKKGKGEKREGGKRESESGTLVGLNDLTADWDLVPYLDIIIISYGFYHSSLSASITYTHHTLLLFYCYYYSGFPIRPLPQFWITREHCLRTCSERAFFHSPSASNCLAWCTHCSQ